MVYLNATKINLHKLYQYIVKVKIPTKGHLNVDAKMDATKRVLTNFCLKLSCVLTHS